MSKFEKLKTKAADMFFKAKSYWRTPPKGYSVCYREFVDLAFGYGAVGLLSVVLKFTTISTSVAMAISHFGLTAGMAWILGPILGAIIAFIRSPILSMIIDNNNSKRGKFKPFIMVSIIASAICFSLICFIPKSWMSISLFNINIPAIPLVGIDVAETMNFNLGLLALFVLTQVGTFFSTLLNQALMGLEQTMTSVAQERANIGALRSLLGNIPGSIVNIILPILAGSLFAKSGAWNSMTMYRIVLPLCALGAIFLATFTVKGVQERVVVNKKYVAKVKFLEGAKILTKSRYFWCITLFNAFLAVRAIGNVSEWIKLYSYPSGSTAQTIAGLYMTTLLMNAFVVGMVAGPLLIKKFGKAKVLRTANIGFLIFIAIQAAFYKNPTIMLISMFFQNVCMGFDYMAIIMVSDILDYLQYKTGKRLEGFWQNYSGIIGTIFGVFTSLIQPIAQALAGLGFSMNVGEALSNVELRNNVYLNLSLVSLIGGVLCILPMLFYNFNEKKHANCVRVLKIRAAIDNYEDGLLTDADIINIKDIHDYSVINPEDSGEIIDEMDKNRAAVEAIAALYDGAKERETAEQRRIAHDEFLRNVEFEQKRMTAKIKKLQKKAAKNNVGFDEEAFKKEFVEKSRFLKEYEEERENKGNE